MPIYSHKYSGFIADVANIDFKRCDGTVQSCSTATASAMNPTANSLSITGGQGQYPIGFIDTDRGLECSFTNAMFDGDMFEVANAGMAVDGDSYTLETKKYSVVTGSMIELPFEVDVNSIYIRGLTLTTGETLDAGKFSAAVNTPAEGEAKTTTLTLNSTDASVGDEVVVSYKRRIASAHDIVVNTNTASAKGEVWMHWPVYSSGTDCTEAAIKGWIHVHVYRVRVTALPAIDSSYKQAATHAMTFTALDPQRADNKMYRITYEALTSDGAYDTAYDANAVNYN